MQPLLTEGRFNARLDIRVLGGPVGSNGFPRSHADLNGGHPGPGEDLLQGVLIPEVLSTYFRPKVVEDETTKDI